MSAAASKSPRRAKIRLVLSSPRTAGNVGACARLCANFGVDEWLIVDPQCDWSDWDAKKLAKGDAGKKLEQIQIVSSVAEAVQDCERAIAFTRRMGKSRVPSSGIREAVALAEDCSKIALVFGNEETGLTRKEIEACTHRVWIPTSAEFASMNLSHAVAVGLSWFYESHANENPPRGIRRPARAAPIAELQGMFQHWRDFLLDAGLSTGGNPERLLKTIRAVFERSALSAQEIRAFRGLLSKTQVRLGTRIRGKKLSSPHQ